MNEVRGSSLVDDHNYGRSTIELLIHTTSFKKMWRAGKYPRLQLELIPLFHSTIPFYCSIPLILDSHMRVIHTFLFTVCYPTWHCLPYNYCSLTLEFTYSDTNCINFHYETCIGQPALQISCSIWKNQLIENFVD